MRSQSFIDQVSRASLPLQKFVLASLGASRAIASHSEFFAVLLIVLAGGSLRLMFFPLAPALIHGDSLQYLNPARSLLAGQGFPLPLERQPLYPLFLALVQRVLGESLERIAAVQHILGMGTAVLTYAAGRLTFGRGAGLIAGLAAALSGGLLMYEHAVMTEALFTFLFMLAVLFYLLGVRRNRWWCYAACGLLVGLATLTRSQTQLLLLLAPLGLAMSGLRPWRSILRSTAIIWCCAALALAPWALRNVTTHGAFFVSGSIGKQFAHRTVTSSEFRFWDPEAGAPDPNLRRLEIRKALQRHSEGLARVPPRNVSLTKTLGELRGDLKLSEVELDNLLRDIALDAIKAKPAVYARLVLEDIWKTLAGRPLTLEARLKQRDRSTGLDEGPAEFLIKPSSPEQLRSIELASRLVNVYQSPWLGPVVPLLFMIGLFASTIVPVWRPALFPALAALSLVIGSAAVTIARFRYHYPIDPLMHVMAFGGLLLLWKLAVGAWRQTRPSASSALERTHASSA